MSTTLHNQAAIAGIGQTAYSKNSGVSELQLATEAVWNAIDDAGIPPSEVDGLVTYTMDSSDEVEVARTVGIGDLTFWSQVNYGGGAAVGLVAHAAMAVATGAAKKRREARERLAGLYGRFSNGLETQSLRDAKRLLEQLA